MRTYHAEYVTWLQAASTFHFQHSCTHYYVNYELRANMTAAAAAPTTFKQAFDKLKDSVSHRDIINLQSTALQVVWKTVIEFEKIRR
jgi:hypothetical protein